ADARPRSRCGSSSMEHCPDCKRKCHTVTWSIRCRVFASGPNSLPLSRLEEGPIGQAFPTSSDHVKICAAQRKRPCARKRHLTRPRTIIHFLHGVDIGSAHPDEESTNG